MTVKFKKPLKPVPGGWVAVDYETHGQKIESEKIYQQFKAMVQQAGVNPCQEIINPHKSATVFDDFYQEFKNELKAKEPQTMMLYNLVVLSTEAETIPKWSIWDTFITTSSQDFLDQFKVQKEIQQQRLTEKTITGYKFVVYQASDGYSNLKYLDDYCESKFEPKPKVYINGPKKSNEFLTKKAKQYANAKNI